MKWKPDESFKLSQDSEADIGLLKTAHLHSSKYVEQLNAAGREVAHGELGMCLLDAALLSAGLTEKERLSDDSHPSEKVWEEMMNIILNIVTEERQLRSQEQISGGER